MMQHKHEIISSDKALREKGFRVTKGRLKLLALLEHSGQPLSIQQILTLWKGTPPNVTTLYRSLTNLNLSEVVRRIDLNTGIAHFEYTPDRPHHHHIICNDCGTIEEIAGCSLRALEKEIVHSSKQFKNISTHNLEFFGHCIRCTKI